MRLTASLPILTLLRASVTPAIFLTEIPERYISQGPPLPRLLSCACSELEYLSDELTLAVARHLKTLDLAGRGQQVALVVAVALPSPGGGQLAVAGFKVLGHLLLEDLLEDGLHALANPGLHVQLHVVVELMFRGQVVSLLTQPTTYQTLSLSTTPEN